MANITISQLPAASSLTGSELVPVVQNGVTVQTTTGAVAGAGALNYPFLTVGSVSGLTQSRYLSTGSGLSLTDNGAGSTLQLNLTGAAQSLDSSPVGIQVKTAINTVSSVSLAVGSGLSVTNANGTTGNPTISFSGIMSNFAALSGTGLVATSGTSVNTVSISGTANQISVTNGNGTSGGPIIALATNPTIPGTSFMTVPAGNAAARPIATASGMFRYNTDLQQFEGYTNTGWNQFSLTGGVTSFSAGTTGFSPSSTTTGAITLTGTLNVASGGTGANTLTGYIYGNGTSAFTASTTIPTSALSGTISNAQLANSAITINGNTVALGSSTTVTAATPSPLTIGTGLSGGSFTGATPVTIAIANSGVTAGTYNFATVTVNAQGQITSASSGSVGTVTSVGLAAPAFFTVSGSPVTSSGTLTLGFSGSALGVTYGGTGATTLTGLAYGNGTSAFTAATAAQVVSTIGTTAVTNSTNTSNLIGGGAGQIPYQSASSTTLFSAAGASGQVLVSGGSGAPTWSNLSSIGVTTISFGTTGLTPSTAASGAVTVAGTLAVANGGTGVTSSSGANSVVLRDANANIVYNNEAPGYTNTVTAAGTTTLTAASTRYQHFSGSTTQTLKFPDETTIPAGLGYIVDNDSSANVTVQDSAGNTIATAVPGGAGWIYSLSNGSATGNWAGYLLPPGNSATGLITWGTAGLNLAGSYLSGVTTLTTSLDASIHGLTVGLGGGSSANNTVVGYQALNSNSTGLNLTAIGYLAGNSVTAVGASTYVGAYSGYKDTGSNNTYVGYSSGQNVSTGAGGNNVGVGVSALYNLTSGGQNVALGVSALTTATTSNGNTAVGYQALYNANRTSDTNGFNTAIGSFSGSAITTGHYNVVLGSYTGSAAPISATGSNYIVLSDGQGNIGAYWNGTNGNMTNTGSITALGGINGGTF